MENNMTSEEITKRFVDTYYELYRMRVVKSKTEFCAPLNLPPSNFIALERGTRTCTLRQICALANSWNVSILWLMTGEGLMLNNG